MKLFLLMTLSLVFGRGGSNRISEQAREMVCRVNLYRRRSGMPPVYLDRRLMESARQHSQDQASHRRLSHRGSRGTNFEMRSRRAGYRFTTGGENVAQGQRGVRDVMATWIRSPGHRANIVSRNKCFGFGEVNGYWTQVFGSGDHCTERQLPSCRGFF
ncbi:hypothetical protein DSO57_1014342 [Entomophthora muscae]|uniref:Uncharacterized protein n=1 Tax=Entomophthora muscae TaxID=34485 RepID=A0ACC2T5D4_9FUNG|nr:hypothetical protein DSO57_1014342 [Entomophthora muscae]